ncbi:MAG TPA: dockerin type I repeat-containing protein, partial [Phycisphaerae bacterium]|nr:dockerin type I repeat-containing protein [Phycisphaerae bacterium]
CTIAGNATVVGGTSARATINNSIISDNTSLNSSATDVSLLVLKNTLLWNTPIGQGYNTAASINVIEQNPMLDTDYKPQAGSPAIDAGDNELALGDLDLVGAVRIFNDVVDLGCFESTLPTGGTIDAFALTDATSGSSLVTNEAGVNVSIATSTPEGVTVTGWLVTESDVAPTEGWLPAAPTTYTIQAASGTDATLYAWIIDSTGGTASRAAAIYYNIAAPVMSGLAISNNGDGTATATWTTDIPAEGSVRYGPVSLAGATPNVAPENALGTAHSVSFAIAAGANYKIIVVNSEVASAPVYWPKPWPIDGDANGDCRVNILDLIFIRNKLNQPVGTGDNWKADVNEDTRINILDLIYVRNKLNTTCP